jgi:hypothetical protein
VYSTPSTGSVGDAETGNDIKPKTTTDIKRRIKNMAIPLIKAKTALRCGKYKNLIVFIVFI